MLHPLAHLAQNAGGLAFFVAALTYLIHRNSLNFTMIMSCNQRFQDIMGDLEDRDKTKKQRAKTRYVDLCNEQLFYFKNGYLPREVIEEWLESMIDYLPLFDNVTGPVRHSGNIEPDLLKSYLTIRKGLAKNPGARTARYAGSWIRLSENHPSTHS